MLRGRPLRRMSLPLAVMIPAVVAADQLTKWIVSRTLPYGRPVEVLGDFLRFTYVKNPALSFSMGLGLAPALRGVMVLVLPLLVSAIMLVLYFTTRELRPFQRWLLAAIVGGGLGNAVDRIFRGGEVVDFIDFKFYGLLGFERWPTFNVADSTVVVAGLLLLVTYLWGEARAKR